MTIKIETTTEKVKVDGVDREAKVQTLKVTKNPDKDFSMGENEFIHLCARTVLGYTRSQKFDIIKQVEEQRELIEAGLTPQEALALDEAEFDTVDTATTARRQSNRHTLTASQASKPHHPQNQMRCSMVARKLSGLGRCSRSLPSTTTWKLSLGSVDSQTTATSMSKMSPKVGTNQRTR